MNVRRGDQGDKVKAVQRALLAHGLHLADGADGLFGAGTEQAVRAFQQHQRLDADGIAGKDTLRALGLHPDTLQPLGSPRTAPASPASGVSQARPPLVWPTSPLPASESGRFVTALASLATQVQAGDDPRKWRYQCWFAKLQAQEADDRIIEWGRICPATSGAVGAAFVVGPCDLSIGDRPTQEAIEQALRSVADVDVAGPALGIISYLKAHIVVGEELTSQPLEGLRLMHDDVQRAVEKLGEWAAAPGLGGSSAMPPAYRAIKDWIARRQGDAQSVYSCL